MPRSGIPMTAVLIILAACEGEPIAPAIQPDAVAAKAGQGPIVHRASVGGPDICTGLGSKPGCNANLSLIAIQRADGSVTGQLTDQYGPADGMHAEIDCLLVQEIPDRIPVALEAWVGGVVTRPAGQAGHRVIARMRDNSTSAANDPRPDAMSRAIVDPEREGASSNCLDMPAIGLAQMPQGQVKIW
jgi:hypothetical protein